MIIDTYNRVKLDDFAYSRLNESVQKYLREQYLERFYHQMKVKGYKSISDLFPYVDTGVDRYLETQYQNIRSELSRFLNSKKAEKGRFQLFPTKKVREYLEQNLDLPVINEKTFALDMASLCYEFFFINMPVYETMGRFPNDLPEGTVPNFTNISYDISNDRQIIYDSFKNLKLNFSLCYAPLSLGIHFLMHSYSVNIFDRARDVSLPLESLDLWLTFLFSEGLYNLIGYDQIYRFSDQICKLNQTDTLSDALKNKHDFFPELSNFFVTLFADIALNMIEKNNYDFTNILTNSQYRGKKNNGIMKFLLTDFMPRVIEEIISLNTISPGYTIYTQLSEIKKGVTIQNNEIRYNADSMQKLADFMNAYTQEINYWNNWYSNKQKNSTSWQYFLKVSSNPSLYNSQDYVINREDLSYKYDFSEYYL